MVGNPLGRKERGNPVHNIAGGDAVQGDAHALTGKGDIAGTETDLLGTNSG